MKSAPAALLILATLALSSYPRAAAAQGSTAEYPSGFGYTQSFTSAPPTTEVAVLSPAQRLAWWVGRGAGRVDSRGRVVTPSFTQGKRSAFRPAGSSGEQGPQSGLSNRSLVRPVGR